MRMRCTCMTKFVTRPFTHTHTPLALYLSLGYALLIVYASLYPLTTWRSSGASALDFLFAGWPRYTTAFDLLTNLAAYVPLGFFLAAALRQWLTAAYAWWLAVLAAVALSFLMELAQNYLPSRVASNLDLAGNALGALLGALPGAFRGRRLIDNLRHTHWPDQGQSVETGLVLMGLWLLIQLDPATLLFGAGDLRRLIALPATQVFSAAGFQRMESLIAASGALAALLAASLIAPHRPETDPNQRRQRAGASRQWLSLHSLIGWTPKAALFPVLLLTFGLAAKTLAFALMMQPQAAFAWATPGSMTGLGAGCGLWLAALALPPALQRALAALALLATSVLVNLAPVNPYLENALHAWNPGQFLNFHGLTHFVTALWPYLVLPWLVLHPSSHAR